MTSSNEPSAEERAEILSHLYVHAARVVGPLASGRYAVCAMARGQIMGMLSEQEVPQLIKDASAQSIQQYDLRMKEERTQREQYRDPSAAVVVNANAEDIGL